MIISACSSRACNRSFSRLSFITSFSNSSFPFRPRFFGLSPSSTPCSLCRRQVVKWDEYSFLTRERIVPFRPIWSGFAINTVFFALIVWPLLSAPFALRRLIRRKRGRCPECGYDLRGELDKGCSECGWNRTVEAST